MKRAFVIAVLLGLLAGLLAQFVWKLIYFPEPIIPVIFELLGFIILTGVAVKFTGSIK